MTTRLRTADERLEEMGVVLVGPHPDAGAVLYGQRRAERGDLPHDAVEASDGAYRVSEPINQVNTNVSIEQQQRTLFGISDEGVGCLALAGPLHQRHQLEAQRPQHRLVFRL
jgi:hypothetical protein